MLYINWLIRWAGKALLESWTAFSTTTRQKAMDATLSPQCPSRPDDSEGSSTEAVLQ